MSVSPFVCLYDNLEPIAEATLLRRRRGVETTSSLLEGKPPPGGDDDDGLNIQSTSTGPVPLATDGRLTLRVLAFPALLVLLTLRSAPCMQCFAVLYVLHWVTSFFRTRPSRETQQVDTEHNYKIRRFTLLLFTALCHVAVYITATASPGPSTTVLAIANGTIFAAISVIFDLSQRLPNKHPNVIYSVDALAGQGFPLTFSCGCLGRFYYSPVELKRKPLPASSSDYERLVECMTPLVGLHLSTVPLCLSRRSLRRASP